MATDGKYDNLFMGKKTRGQTDYLSTAKLISVQKWSILGRLPFADEKEFH